MRRSGKTGFLNKSGDPAVGHNQRQAFVDIGDAAIRAASGK
jgi:hypothetical protein